MLTHVLFPLHSWGCIFATFWVFLLVFGVAFLAVWDPTRPAVMFILSQVVAIAITFLVKFLILRCLRKMLFSGFFRVHPASSNIMMVILEVWALGLTIGSMLVRLVKLIAVSAFYVGRIDTFIFAPGVGTIGPVSLDSYPIQFRKDLLLHDAHRHPYMERLGLLYMLKLRHSDDFGLPAGSAWRIIVVQALMPWLRRFRIDEAEESNDDGEDDVLDLGEEGNSGKTPFKSLKSKMSVMAKRLAELERKNQILEQANQDVNTA